MKQLIKFLITAAKKALRTAGRDRRADGNAPPTPRSGCVLCDIKLPVVGVDGVTHHEARHGGRRVLLRCTHHAKVRADARAGNWPTGW
jgi:hypothetical protein